MVRIALASLLFMACAHATDKLASCVHACDTPEPEQVEAIEAASCEALTHRREVPLAQPPASRQ